MLRCVKCNSRVYHGGLADPEGLYCEKCGKIGPEDIYVTGKHRFAREGKKEKAKEKNRQKNKMVRKSRRKNR